MLENERARTTEATRRRYLQEAFRATSAHDRTMGAKAYPTYHDTLRGLASHYGALFIPTVEAFVAMSPNSDYHGNLRSLVSLLVPYRAGGSFDDCVISTYRGCGARAWGYLTGEVSFLDTVKGRKITSFRDNILYPDTSRKVTVDGHMICIAAGKDLTMTEANFLMRDRHMYADIEGPVLAIAAASGLPVAAVQATLWTWRKRTLAIKFDSQADLFTGMTRWDRVLHPDELLPYAKGEVGTDKGQEPPSSQLMLL